MSKRLFQIYWFELTTPWSIELNKDILGLIIGDVIKVLSNQNLDCFLVPVFWDFLCLKEWRQCASIVVSNELSVKKEYLNIEFVFNQIIKMTYQYISFSFI